MVFKPRNMSQPFHKTDAKQHTQQKKVNDYKKQEEPNKNFYVSTRIWAYIERAQFYF